MAQQFGGAHGVDGLVGEEIDGPAVQSDEARDQKDERNAYEQNGIERRSSANPLWPWCRGWRSGRPGPFRAAARYDVNDIQSEGNDDNE